MTNPTLATEAGTSLFAKSSLLFAGAMLISGIGTLIGMPMGGSLIYLIVTMIAFLGLAIIVPLNAKTAPAPVILGLFALFSFVAGLFIGPCIGMYVQALGAATVGMAYLGTGGIMCVCGLIATLSSINFRRMEGYLTLGLFAMIIVGLIACFTGMTTGINLVYSSIGVVLFTGFYLVDFQRLAQSKDNSWGEAVSVTGLLFMDFLNMLLYVLRILFILLKKK